MEYKNVIGIDVSKLTLDLCLLTYDGECAFYQCINNGREIIALLDTVFCSHDLTKEHTLLCAEYTGHYGNQLTEAALLNGYQLWLENPAQIKNSQGVQRGKDDRKDAERIACYAKRFADRVILLQPISPVYTLLAYLCAERDLLLTDAAKYKAQLKDENSFIEKELFKAKQKRYKNVIKHLEKAIKEIETEIDQTISNNACCFVQYDLLVSIDGIGRQVAVHTIIETKGFTRFKDARKFACHAGVAPFKYWSGSSIRSAHKVSHRANKNLKRLLHMAALSAIRMKGEMQTYYNRKVAEGKNKMTVINAVRAKLIARMFAIVKRNQNY